MVNGFTHPLAPYVATMEAATALGKTVGCGFKHLRNIRDGHKVPSLQLAKRLSDATGIRMDAFLRPEAAE